MSNVTLHIGGRDYMVSCAEGEEAHVEALGQLIADKVQTVGTGGTNEVRQLLFAALLLADELTEARRSGGPTAAPAPTGPDPALLESIAARLEACASALEG